VNQNLIQRLQAVLPLASARIDYCLQQHVGIGCPVISLGVKRLTASSAHKNALAFAIGPSSLDKSVANGDQRQFGLIDGTELLLDVV
jgi:hypothetical protein